MTHDVICNFSELSNLVPALRKAVRRVTQDERFEDVKEALTASAERINKYKKEHPEFVDHPILRATESTVEALLYEYEDRELIARREHQVVHGYRIANSGSDYLKPAIEYLEFLQRISP
jgi:hypothetical protein